MKLIIFPRYEKIEIKRPEKYGGNVLFKSYNELEKKYIEKKLHPSDLKLAISEYLEKIIDPIRKNYK
jgi:tyrosyl-tRNA synthetase